MPTESRRIAGARAAGLLAAALLLLLAACAPRFMPAGPPLGEPRLLEDRWIAADGAELPLRAWLPEGEPDAVLLALHGFNDYSAAFESPGEWWAAHGIATYAYDQRGFGAAPHPGLWAGTETLARDLAAAARLIKARHPGAPFYLLGESMGAAVVMVALADGPPVEADGAILAAPAVWARSTMPGYQRWALQIAGRIIPWGRLTGQNLDIQASDNLAALRRLGRDPLVIKRTRIDAVLGLTNLMDAALAAAPRITVPLLVLYGERDEVIPREPTFRAWRELPGAAGRQRLALYEDGWHLLLRDLEAETVLADVRAWVAEPTAPLPSGADRRARAALAGLGPVSESP